MQSLEEIKARLPEAAKDLRINLSNVLSGQTLSAEQAWGVALSCAYFLRSPELITAISAEATGKVSEAVFEDAKAAASLMGMNTVFYRFRHMVGSNSYEQRPARLRVMRINTPAVNKAHLELCSLACAALAGCETCIKAHEHAIRESGLSEDHVQDAVRIAAVLSGVAIGLGIPHAPLGAPA